MRKRKLYGENNTINNEFDKKYYQKDEKLIEDENKGKKEDLNYIFKIYKRSNFRNKFCQNKTK